MRLFYEYYSFKNDSLINYFSDDAVATGQIQLTDPMQLLADPNLYVMLY